MIENLPTLRSEQTRGVRYIQFKTPHNTLTRALIADLRRELQKHLQDSLSRVLVLRGSGDRLFSPGLDLRQVASLRREQMREFMLDFCALYRELFTHPKPTVAALNGHALAGGCILASSCDFRFAAQTARIGFTPLNRYFPIPAGCQRILHFRLGTGWVSKLLYQACSLAAEEAEEAGWLNWIGPLTELDDRVKVLATELTALSSRTFELSKGNLQHALSERQLFRLDEEQLDSFLDCWFAPDTQQEIQALESKLRGTTRVQEI